MMISTWAFKGEADLPPPPHQDTLWREGGALTVRGDPEANNLCQTSLFPTLCLITGFAGKGGGPRWGCGCPGMVSGGHLLMRK